MLGGEQPSTIKLAVDNVTVRYGTGRHTLWAAERISFALPKGSILGLVGESGSGKSTVAKAIVGLVPIAEGRVLLDGVDFASARLRDRSTARRRIQMIFQDPYSSLNPRMTVGDAIAEALKAAGTSPGANQSQVERLLGLVQISKSALARYPHEFSGGQRQRIAIARALAVEPEVLISDEITSSLDVSVQATILNLLRDLQRQLALSVLFISHDLGLVRYMSDAVAVMYLGRLIESAGSAELFDRPRHPYTAALVSAAPQVGRRLTAAPLGGDFPDPRNPPTGCRFHTRCTIGPLALPERTICVESDPGTDAAMRENKAACHFPLGHPSHRHTPAEVESSSEGVMC